MFLGIDVTARKASELAHQRLQEVIIAMQAAALVAPSTPLIAIDEDVVVMPLIGSIDEARARQIMETLLWGTSRSRTSTAILDITTVVTVDPRVAHALLQAAQAARMLGAQVVLTGIRRDVAQTLVRQGRPASRALSPAGPCRAALRSLSSADKPAPGDDPPLSARLDRQSRRP
ncbi:STAS domain-containing protein [Sorangium sp. So ce590]|uniref:STAS domain-containing protein n=1 Tax=Sorangium sp. So ce590 TaxID=3133317 RepID=UPI003F5EEA6F